MPKEVRGIIISRLFILIAIILVPIIVFLLFNLTDFNVWYSNNTIFNIFVVKFLTPLTYSVSWLYFLLLFANRFANTIESMEDKINIIPLRLKIFYGINAMFVLFIFAFPLITPVISILSFVSMMWQLTTFKKESWDDDSKAPLVTKLLMVIISILPIFCTVSIALDYLKLPIFIWVFIWIPLLDHIYIFSFCLCTSLAIGSLFILISNRGVSEYEQLFSEPQQEKSMFYIGIFEVGLVGFFLFLDYFNYPVIDFFYNMGFIIVLFVSIVNYFSGKRKSKKFSSHVLGYILAALFMGSNLFLYNAVLSDFMKNSSLAILAAIFIIVFVYAFVTIEE